MTEFSWYFDAKTLICVNYTLFIFDKFTSFPLLPPNCHSFVKILEEKAKCVFDRCKDDIIKIIPKADDSWEMNKHPSLFSIRIAGRDSLFSDVIMASQGLNM